MKSPYDRTEISSGFLGYYVHQTIPVNADDGYIEIIQKWVNRPDLLSLDIYGTHEYWWIIPQRNGLEDPIFDLTLGRTVIVPPADLVKRLFG